MVKRRVLLIVFSISSILVLAGFSINEKAYASAVHPPFGDFLCWDTSEGELSFTNLLKIEDQFGAIFNQNVWEQVEYCTAATKFIGEEEFTSPFFQLKQHYQGWSYPFETVGPGTDMSVIIDVPQFGQNFQATLGLLDEILVPASKTLPGINGGTVVDSVDLEHHWNCYEMFGPAPREDVLLVTQHGDVTATVGEPFLFCAPMQKTAANENVFGSFLIPDHMICYDLFNIDDSDITNLPTDLADQLTGPSGVPFFEDFVEKLCVPAFKSFPVVGGSMIPIDTSALLLAGVQSISMWMIPVIVAGVGIGIFVIKRRN